MFRKDFGYYPKKNMYMTTSLLHIYTLIYMTPVFTSAEYYKKMMETTSTVIPTPAPSSSLALTTYVIIAIGILVAVAVGAIIYFIRRIRRGNLLIDN